MSIKQISSVTTFRLWYVVVGTIPQAIGFSNLGKMITSQAYKEIYYLLALTSNPRLYVPDNTITTCNCLAFLQIHGTNFATIMFALESPGCSWRNPLAVKFSWGELSQYVRGLSDCLDNVSGLEEFFGVLVWTAFNQMIKFLCHQFTRIVRTILSNGCYQFFLDGRIRSWLVAGTSSWSCHQERTDNIRYSKLF